MSSAEGNKTESIKKQVTKAAAMLQTLVKPTIAFVSFVLPYVIEYSKKAYAMWMKLPHDEAQVIIGGVFAFFGGLYPTLFAAIQACKHGGIETVTNALEDLAEEALKIIEENEKDDKKDEDKDGIADVEQVDGRTLLLRKINLVAVKMNPAKVDTAISALYRVWLSVIATLSIQFARTIAMALTISDFLKKPVTRFIAPTIELAVPDQYDKWVPIILGWITKSIAMSIAWYVQTIISAVTSALQGGLMMSRALLAVGRKRGFKFIPDHEDTYVDEIASYVIAALGFYFQFKLGFSMPFPLNLLLFPFEIAEYYIRWTITFAGH